MNIKFTPRAESEAEAKTRWWRRNRQASPDLFDDELAEALAAIRRDPTIGAIHPTRHPAIVRKRLMPRTKNHVYFAVHEGDDPHRVDLVGAASPWPEAVMEMGAEPVRRWLAPKTKNLGSTPFTPTRLSSSRSGA